MEVVRKELSPPYLPICKGRLPATTEVQSMANDIPQNPVPHCRFSKIPLLTTVPSLIS